MNKTIILTAVIALIVGVGAGYFGANALRPSAVQNTRGNFTAGVGAFNGTRGVAGGLLSGTVAKEESGSITLNTRDGNSHLILVTPATSVSKSVTGALSDVAVGSTIIVSGTTNSDGSVSATLVQLRPAAPPTAQQ